MIIRSIKIDEFRAFSNVEVQLGKRITAIAGRNATQKTTILGLISQPFTISKGSPMYGSKTVDGYNFKSQFKEKFKLSPKHDVVGKHNWELRLYRGVYKQDYFKVTSIARKENGKESLRFWNAEGGRSSGSGYIQVPVYFLSLSRLFPIGEARKTKREATSFTPEETAFCLKNYREILSIQEIKKDITAKVDIEKGTAVRTFAGVSDLSHDILTNSAGEGNVMKIILAVLSFQRLKNRYSTSYKGGILLIDELDATLHSFSQKMLVDFLYKSALDYQIQVVFTTHSPIILDYVSRKQVSWGREHPSEAWHDWAIVHLEPNYHSDNTRFIEAKNVTTRSEMLSVQSMMDLTYSQEEHIHVYCEDHLAMSFVDYVLQKHLKITPKHYLEFIDINLGWPNYLLLARRKIPEFTNNLIILDADVAENYDFKKSDENQKTFKNSGNFLMLPLTIEKDLFFLLKEPKMFNEFRDYTSMQPNLNFDIFFSKWPSAPEDYQTSDYKAWFKHAIDIIHDKKILFDFWCHLNIDKVTDFCNEFTENFNKLAEKRNLDCLP